MKEPIFRSGSGRARLVVWLFVAGVATEAFSIASDIAEIELAMRMDGGTNWTMAEAESNDTRVAVIASLDMLVVLAGMIAFLSWLYRARANLPALGITDARWGPGWAVGWWFIPFMNLVRPFQLVKEVWKASDREAAADSWRDAPTPAFLGWWWALFLISSFASNIASRLALRGPDTIDAMITSDAIFVFSEAFWIIGTFPALMLVKGIDRRQTARHMAIRQGTIELTRAEPES